MPSHNDIQSILENTHLQIERLINFAIENRLKYIECVTILGPRQIGKTTLAKLHFVQQRGAIYRDLQESKARAEVGTGHKFFEQHKNNIIVLDEIQECQHLFKNIKVFIDEQRFLENKECRFLLFGSASLDAQRKAFTSLAGRVSQIQMYGILPSELIGAISSILPSESEKESRLTCRKITDILMLRGGMPLSLFADSNQKSLDVREDFIESYIEKDIDKYGLNVDRTTLNICLNLIAKVNGKQFEIGTFTRQLKTDQKTVQNTIDALEQLLLIRPIEPWSDINGFGVRVTKHTKVYVRDSGLLLFLLDITDRAKLLKSKHHGMIWESFVIESVIGTAVSTGKYMNCSFYRTHDGKNELDLRIKFRDQTKWGIEIKLSEPKHMKSGNIRAAKAVGVDRLLVIHNGTNSYDLNGGFEAMPLHQALDEILKSKTNSS